MRRSSTISAELDRRGIWYPRGEGDRLRAVAQCWRDLADFIEELTPVLNAAAARVTENYTGESASRFAEAWQRWALDPGYLAQTVDDCRRLAAAAADFGGDIDAADETLLRLLEEALDYEHRALAVGADPGVANEWLARCAVGLADDLGARADRHDVHIDCTLPRRPGPDLSNIDPDAIDWPDPGDPSDLSILGNTVVDFGAGQGDLGEWDPGEWVDDPPVDGPPVDESPTDDGDGSGGGGGSGLDGLDEYDSSAFGGGGGGLGDLGGGLGGGLGDLDGGGFGLPEAGLAAAGVGAAALAGGAASGRMPFMPMMPMGGMGAGGDDGQEPKRKVRRRLAQLPVPPATN